jgi:Zn-dependent peptidase ImmA (M78 family)/transcriptional regulator with XRE-family HTH domain
MSTALIGKRLKALRDQRALSQVEVAEIMGFKDRQTISAIENGERAVKAEELLTLVEKLGVDFDYFTDALRLEGEGRFSWRRGGEVPAERLDNYERSAGRWIAAYRELSRRTENLIPLIRPQLPLDKFSTYAEAADAGERFAHDFELGDFPSARLAEVMEQKLGILVLMVNSTDGISGAACSLPELGAVLINRHEVKGRRHFDLAHELFHLMTWDKMPPERSEALDSRSHVEKLADRFASAVLMPRWLLQDIDWRTLIGLALPEAINARATALGVSADALRWRLAHTGLLAQKTAKEIPAAALKHNGGGLPARPEVPPLYSREFMSVVVNAVGGGFISVRRTAGLLDTTIEGLAQLITAHGLPMPDTLH